MPSIFLYIIPGSLMIISGIIVYWKSAGEKLKRMTDASR